MDINYKYFSLCKKLFENKVQNLVTPPFKRQDLLFLIDEIYRETNILLSLSTLSRLWNDNKSFFPQIKTLDALCKYIGYSNWYDFKANQPINNEDSVDIPIAVKLRKKSFFYYFLSLLLFVSISIIISSYHKNKSVKYNDEGIIFKVASFQNEGVPATVKYYYDLPTNRNKDFFLYTDNYDKQVIKLDTASHYISVSYVFPGIFYPHLQYDNNIIKKLDLIVPTKNWQGIISYEGKKHKPIVFQEKDIFSNGYLHISPDNLDKYNIPVQENIHYITYIKVKDFKNSINDNFIFETRLKNDIEYGASPCQGVSIRILCENGIIQIPFSKYGYTTKILKIGKHKFKGTTTDLSMFCCNISKFQTIKFINLHKEFSIYKNGELINSFKYDESLGRAIGVKFRFFGCGTVEFVKLYDENKNLIMSDVFKL